MKNTIRVRRNGATKPASTQTKTGSGSAPTAWRSDVNDCIDLLREAKAEANALHTLLSDVLFIDDGGVYGEEIHLGITALVLNAHARMDNAVESVEALLDSKTEVAS